MGEPTDEIVVDLREKRTEAGWQAWIDRTALRAAPLWFEWLGWIAALAALEYLRKKSGSRVVTGITVVSILLLWYYFNGFFFRFSVRGFPAVKPVRVERAISILLAGVTSYVVWRFATSVAEIVAANTP